MILLLLEDLWVYAKGGKSYFKDFWKQFFGDPKAAMARFQAAGRTIERFFKFISSLLGGKGTSKEAKFLMMIATAVAFLVATIGAVPVVIATALALLATYWEDIEKFFKDLGKRISEYFGGEFQQLWADAWENIKEIASNIANSLKSKWVEFKNYLVGLLNGVRDFFVGIWDSIVSAFESAKDSIFKLWDNLVADFEDGCNSIGNALSNAANVARRAWEGFINWLQKKWDWLKDKLPDFLKAADNLPKLEGANNIASKGTNGGGNTNINNNSNINNNVTVTNDVSADKFIKNSGFVPQVNRGIT